MTASRREQLLIALILVASVVLRPPGLEFAPDDAAGLVTADQVAYGAQPYLGAPYPKPLVSLGFFLLLARLPRSVWVTQAVNLALSLLIEVMVLLAARRLWGRRGGVAAMATAGALLLLPWAGAVSVVLPVALFTVGAALGVVTHTLRRAVWLPLMGAGLFLGLAVGASISVTAGAVALVFAIWFWARPQARWAMPLAFLATVGAVTVMGRMLGGDGYFTCLSRGMDYYLGTVQPRYAAEACLHSLELYLEQPAPLLALGLAGILALRQIPAQAHAMAPTMALWLAGAVLDASWGRRFEAGAWMPLVPVIAMGAGAFVGAGKRSRETDRGGPLVMAVVVLAVLLLLPRVKVTAGHYRDILEANPPVSPDVTVTSVILGYSPPGTTMFIWGDNAAAAAHCHARLVPPDPYLPDRLAGVWRTTEEIERHQPRDLDSLQRLLQDVKPKWIVLQTDGDFGAKFPWWSYQPLAAVLEKDYALTAEVPGRSLYRHR